MTATGLDGKNVINYNLAATITLQDGYDFCVPYEFTAQNISYKRSFEAGCTTLMVPFEVTTIPEGLTAYEFASEDGSEVTFNKLEKLSAFEGSLVKVDAAKEYTFTAANQKLFNNYTDAAAALNFKFIGISSCEGLSAQCRWHQVRAERQSQIPVVPWLLRTHLWSYLPARNPHHQGHSHRHQDY